MNELMNFNKIFSKDVAFDNVKSHKKAEIWALTLFEKPRG